METVFLNKLYRSITWLFFTLLLTVVSACSSGGDDDEEPVENETYTLSGTINAGASDVADSDVNDPLADYTANDTFSAAQSIPNPATLGGYVNQPNSGESGRSMSSGDISDRFAASLLAGQSINLTVADTDLGDADLYLYEGTCTESCYVSCDFEAELGNGLVGKSVTEGELETITVSENGNYFIEVCAWDGASNYTLAIGQAPSSAPALTTDADFVPGEVIVKFKENGVTTQQTSSHTLESRAATVGLKPLAGTPGRQMLMSLGDAGQQNIARATLGLNKKPSQKAKLKAARQTAEQQLKLETLDVISALRKRVDVLYAEPNYIRQALATPNDTYYAYQWHYPQINLPDAWDITTGSSNVIVSVIDTGVLLNHPDMVGQLIGGYDFISDPSIAVDGDGIDSNPDDPGDSDGTRPSSFHGTHVAGTVAAASNNDNGVAGIAWQSKIMPMRVLGRGGGTSYDINQSILYSAQLANDSNTLPPQKADIINMSLGGAGFSQADQDVITQARNAGVIIIAAAGNENTSSLSYPASYDGVVSVSAVGFDKSKASYSNYGTAIDIAAPGGETSVDLNADGYADGVLSTAADDSNSLQYNYVFYQGTSMAAPHMAGVVALMKAVEPTLTPNQLDTLIASSMITEDLGTAGRDDLFGHGLIDAYKAVTEVQGGVTLPAHLDVTPATVNLGSLQSTKTLLASNSGEEALTGVTAVSNQTWLTVSDTQVDGNGLGSYTLSANRAGLADGTYSADVTFSSAANTVTVKVFMQVGTISTENSSGFIYVLLLDENGDNVGQANVAVFNGQYAYSIPDVSAGTYTLVAGSDIDNDQLICDRGESCGAYLTLDNVSQIVISGDRPGLNFGVQHQSSILAESAASIGQDKAKQPNTHPGYKRKP
ncbi:MAG: S8 family serine peptidase [Gammaproteobacteria bacterium]|nr:S8 family serine peptidase [Gammaproteobacteria bacterium]